MWYYAQKTILGHWGSVTSDRSPADIQNVNFRQQTRGLVQIRPEHELLSLAELRQIYGTQEPVAPKSCPFCGSSDSEAYEIEQYAWLWRCKDCGCMTCSSDSIEGARKLWDRRPEANDVYGS